MQSRSPISQHIPVILASLLLLTACSPSTISAASPTAPITPTATPAATSLASPSIPPTSTLTPIPTLPPEQAQALILDLLQNNGGCRLPCFWGITPGETTLRDAYAFLSSLSSYIHATFEGAGNEGLIVRYPVPKEISTSESMSLILDATGGIVENIWADATISLSKLLTDYGKPAEVRIVVSTYMSPPYDVNMGIYYPEQHILAIYHDGYSKLSPSGNIIACFDENDEWDFNNIRLISWSPGISLAWEDFDLFSGWPTPQPNFEDAIGMGLETFYQTYKDPNKKPCFETPEELW